MADSHILFLVFTYFIRYVFGQNTFDIPDLRFEAFSPRGLLVSMPYSSDIKLFGFHGNINKPIQQIEPGDISEDITRPTNGRFNYFNPNLELKVGDVINYWVFVQVDQLGYRKSELSWKVDKIMSLDNPSPTKCQLSSTLFNGISSCVGNILHESRFNLNNVDGYLWLTEKYYPDKPDYEYVIYGNDEDVLNVEGNLLHIKPKFNESIVRSNINIEGCTRQQRHECERRFVSIYQPPIISARIKTKSTFTFGKYEIRAKLPKGDWIYPEIFLEDPKNPTRRVIIAYARGNEVLTGDSGDDIGGSLLFGGPMASNMEPQRSRYLSSYRNKQPIANEMHTFILEWTPEQMSLYIDDINYGEISKTALQETGFNRATPMHLVLGVGVGGPIHFPNGYTSKTYVMPWKSTSSTQLKNFYDSKSLWLPTWGDDSQLQIELVKITAI